MRKCRFSRHCSQTGPVCCIILQPLFTSKKKDTVLWTQIFQRVMLYRELSGKKSYTENIVIKVSTD
jgi:hypothetical protein